MTIPLTWSLDWGPLTGLLFAAGVLLIGLAVAAASFSRRWALLPLALGSIPLGLSLAGQAAAIAGRPALTVTASHVACTPWLRGVAWSDVASVSSGDEKMRYGWRDVGFVLRLRPELADAAASPAAPDRGVWLAITRFSRNMIGAIGTSPEPVPGGTLYCQTRDLAADPAALKRLAQELQQANARPGDRAGIRWCEASGNLTWPCVANAERWHRHCAGRGGDYDACRRSGL